MADISKVKVNDVTYDINAVKLGGKTKDDFVLTSNIGQYASYDYVHYVGETQYASSGKIANLPNGKWSFFEGNNMFSDYPQSLTAEGLIYGIILINTDDANNAGSYKTGTIQAVNAGGNITKSMNFWVENSTHTISFEAPPYSNENLIDNPWFTVNQRGGNILPPEVPYYTSIANAVNKVSAGTNHETYTALPTDTANVYKYVAMNGSTYYCRSEDVVAGYVGNYIYSVDRWITGTPVHVKTQPLGGIELKANRDNWALSQVVDLSTRDLGSKTVTFSIDVAQIKEAEGDAWRIFLGYGASESSAVYAVLDFDTVGIHSKTITLPINTRFLRYGIHRIGSYTSASTIKINHCKLELGSICTITKDAPTNYALELAKCQRYAQELCINRQYAPLGWVRAESTTNARGIIPLIAPLRTIPALGSRGSFVLLTGGASTAIAVSGITLNQIGNAVLAVNISANGLTANTMYALWHLGNNAKDTASIFVSADL